MAYSSYGGLVFRNGEPVIERSDCVMKADGSVKGSPGVYPGFAAIAEGMPRDEVVKMGQNRPMSHAVLGNPPLLLLLHKQTLARVFLAGRRVQTFQPTEEFWDRVDAASELEPAVETHTFSLDMDDKLPEGFPYTKFEVIYRQGEQIAVYARVTVHDGEERPISPCREPGTIWTGWSAYGAGAGFEDEDCNGKHNTELHNRVMQELFVQTG